MRVDANEAFLRLPMPILAAVADVVVELQRLSQQGAPESALSVVVGASDTTDACLLVQCDGQGTVQVRKLALMVVDMAPQEPERWDRG